AAVQHLVADTSRLLAGRAIEHDARRKDRGFFLDQPALAHGRALLGGARDDVDAFHYDLALFRQDIEDLADLASPDLLRAANENDRITALDVDLRHEVG